MARLKKCVLCGDSILPTEAFVPYKGKYVHQHCFDASMRQLGQSKRATLATRTRQQKEKKQKEKVSKCASLEKELKEGMSEEEYAKKKRYYEYLKSLLEDETLTIKQFAVSEKYIERYNFTFEGMYQTLVYLNEILRKELKGDVVGIIPYFYEECERFNKDLQQIEKNSENVEWDKLYPEKTVSVKRCKPGRKYKQLSVDDIGQ